AGRAFREGHTEQVGEEGWSAAEEPERDGRMKAKQSKKVKGVFEKISGSGEWWIRYADAAGRIRREKVGMKGAAIELYQKRKTQVRERKKLPERFRTKPVLFADLAEATLSYSKAYKISYEDDGIRMKKIREYF